MWKPRCDIFLDYILELKGFKKKKKVKQWNESIRKKSRALGYSPTFPKDVKPGFYFPTLFNVGKLINY